MNKKITIGMLLFVAMVIIPGVSAYPGFSDACNECHSYPPQTISITTNITSITVNPGQMFTVLINWNGGNPSGKTEINWPTTFSNIGISRDNTLFNPAPRIPVSVSNTISGTTTSNLTAPQATGTYHVRVYASRKSPWETDYKDIEVIVQAVPLPVLTTVTISPLNPTIAAGSSQQFTATTLDQDGAPISATLTWSSSNASVGTINTNGMFTASGEGTATITVTAVNGSVTKTNSTTVTVTSVPRVLTTVTISPLNPIIAAGSSQQFTATTLDQDGAPISATLTWSSSNTKVGTINSTGWFIASKAGRTTIKVTAVSGSVTINATTKVTVSAARNEDDEHEDDEHKADEHHKERDSHNENQYKDEQDKD